MSELIGIVGESGTGKSTSIGQNKDLKIEGLNPKETAIINTIGKPLPIKGWKKHFTEFKGSTGNYLISDNHSIINKFMTHISEKRNDIKYIIIDDFQYIMSNEFMHRTKEKGYDKWNEMAHHVWSILNHSKTLRDDIKVFTLTHSDSGDGYKKIKTLGKLLDDKVTLEGLYTILLYSITRMSEEDKVEYKFVTNNDGEYPAKSPAGMFKDIYVPNDLGYISKQIDEYYEG